MAAYHLLLVTRSRTPLFLPVPVRVLYLGPRIDVNVTCTLLKLYIEDDSNQIHFMRERSLIMHRTKSSIPFFSTLCSTASTAAAALQVAVERCSDIPLIIWRMCTSSSMDASQNGVDLVKQLAEILPSTTAVVMTSCDHWRCQACLTLHYPPRSASGARRFKNLEQTLLIEPLH